ncbi:MAG: hypothetical protein AAFR28_14350 [Pseudomonadota bacterium]
MTVENRIWFIPNSRRYAWDQEGRLFRTQSIGMDVTLYLTALPKVVITVLGSVLLNQLIFWLIAMSLPKIFIYIWAVVVFAALAVPAQAFAIILQLKANGGLANFEQMARYRERFLKFAVRALTVGSLAPIRILFVCAALGTQSLTVAINADYFADPDAHGAFISYVLWGVFNTATLDLLSNVFVVQNPLAEGSISMVLTEVMRVTLAIAFVAGLIETWRATLSVGDTFTGPIFALADRLRAKSSLEDRAQVFDCGVPTVDQWWRQPSTTKIDVVRRGEAEFIEYANGLDTLWLNASSRES